VTADVDTIRRLHPENARFAQLGEDDRLVVSEPFSDLPGVWEPIPEATALRVGRGGVCERVAFAPRRHPSIWDQRASDSGDWLRMAGDRIFGSD